MAKLKFTTGPFQVKCWSDPTPQFLALSLQVTMSNPLPYCTSRKSVSLDLLEDDSRPLGKS